MSRLKECREAKGLSQKYVALTIGVKPPQISKWETGAAGPSRKNCLKLADLYGVTVDYLLGVTDEPQQKEKPISTEGLGERLIRLILDLSPEEQQRAMGFVEGIKASRKV